MTRHRPVSPSWIAVLAIGLALLLGACAATDTPDPYVERPVEELYNVAMDQMEAGDYKTAAKSFDEVERQHPYSQWATKAQVMAAYSLYLVNDYDGAVLALDRFISLHPGNQYAPYAYYLKGLCYYEQISDIARDQRMSEQALATYTDLVRRFPDTAYARDARLKIDLTHDHLAGKEMDVGRYYLRRGNHLAAIGRFRLVIAQYGTTTHVPEALHRLVEAYLALGIVDEARRTASVLGHNYPDSIWYKDTWKLMAAQKLLTQDELAAAGTPADARN